MKPQDWLPNGCERGHRNGVVKIFTEFNAKKLGDVTDDNLAKLIEKAENILPDKASGKMTSGDSDD
ncbi:MAG TPA: hypothetical protein ACHBX0_12405 [Arsenophonus sp.]